MLDDLLKDALKNISKAEKENMINVLQRNIEKLINVINDYIEVEDKVYSADEQAGYSVSDTPFYLWTALLVNKELLKRKTNALNNIDELEKIEKELLAEKQKIELPNSRWKNANRYQEPNNPELQSRVAEILANNPFLLKQDFISEANQEQLPDNSSKNWNKVHCPIS